MSRCWNTKESLILLVIPEYSHHPWRSRYAPPSAFAVAVLQTRSRSDIRDPATLHSRLAQKVAGLLAASCGSPFGPSATPMFATASCLRSPAFAGMTRGVDQRVPVANASCRVSKNFCNAAAQAAAGFLDFIQRHRADREAPFGERRALNVAYRRCGAR